MISSRIVIIRVIVSVIILTANFAMIWYLYGRYDQLSHQDFSLIEERTGEINNPRVNYSVINKIIEEMKNREIYTGDEQINVNIQEKDPFYR